MSFLSGGLSHQTLSGRLDEQLHQYPHHTGNDCRTEAEHREDNSVKPCFDAVKSRNEGSHLTLKPSKTSGYIVRPTGYFHFPPLIRTLRTHWSMIPLNQYPCNNPDRPHPSRPITLYRLKNGWGRKTVSYQFLHKCCISSAILTLAGVKQ